MRKSSIIIAFVMFSTVASATQLEFTFKSPMFNGNGYGTYVQQIQNTEYTRDQTIKANEAAAVASAASAANNSILNQFVNNLQSRIYAQVSQNIANQLFNGTAGNPSTTCASQSAGCTVQFPDGSNVTFWNDGTNVNLQVVGGSSNSSGVTTVQIPIGAFKL
jgi:Type VIII secretion system (T8SS), CsgF protein